MSLLDTTELLGFAAALIAGYAYIPQIRHIIKEQCTAGVSRRAFSLWLLASVFVLVRAVAVYDLVFIVLAGVQVVAISIILFYCTRYNGKVCSTHAASAKWPDPY